jgi:hypothetical protein
MHVSPSKINNSLHATALTPENNKSEQSGSLSFGDVLDTVNPLQHIPVVSSLYRSATGDEISKSARFVGDSLFGGVLGAASAAVNILSETVTGKDIAENVVDSIGNTASSPYQQVSGVALQADTNADFTNNIELNTNTQANTTPVKDTAQSKNFFELSKEKKEQDVSNLGLDNEGLRRQLLGELDETLYKKL